MKSMGEREFYLNLNLVLGGYLSLFHGGKVGELKLGRRQ